MLGFQEKVGEIRGPHAKKLVIRRRHREPFRYAQVVDFAVVELEHALERAVLLATQPEGQRVGMARKLAANDLESVDTGLNGGVGSRAAFNGTGSPSSGVRSPRLSALEGEVTLQRGLDWLERLTGGALSLKEALEGPEKLLIEGALRRHQGRRDQAAKELEINRSTLFNKMRKYDLLHVDFSAPAGSGEPPVIQPDMPSFVAASATPSPGQAQ